LVQSRGTARPTASSGTGHSLAENLCGCGTSSLQRNPQAVQDTGGNSLAFTQQTQKEVFRTDVIVAELSCFINGQFNDTLGTGSKAGLSGARSFATAADKFHCRPYFIQTDTQVGQHFGGDTLFLSCQPKKDVLRADITVVHLASFFLGDGQHPSRPLGELFKSTGHFSPWLYCPPLFGL